jgi:hypothetical protein
MDTEQSTEIQAPDVAEAENAVTQARAALDEARQATKAAEEAHRARQADEAVALQVFEQAAHRVRDVYAAERTRIEEKMRAAEQDLQALNARLSDLEVAPAPSAAPAAPVVIEPPVDLQREAPDSSDAHEEPAAAPAPADTSSAEGAAYEDDWYRSLKQRSQNDSSVNGQ